MLSRNTKIRAAAIVLVLLVLELFSWAALRLIETSGKGGEGISARYQVDHAALATEMQSIYYAKPRYHPGRWYALPANYRGNYVRTDAYGFRIDRDPSLLGKDKIALFGGSTMFSTTTRQEGTIAAALAKQVDASRVAVLNYGIGGYSTSAEIATLVEAIRVDPGIRVAVFYDGVNEVGRYLEQLQDQRDDAYYPVMGYPFGRTLDVALENELGAWLPYRPKMLILADFVQVFLRKMAGQGKLAAKSSGPELEAEARKISGLYVANVQIMAAIARANGITPIFLWQPDMFLTGKKLTERELALRDSRSEMLKNLTLAVYRQVLTDPRLRQLHFFDVSDVLNALPGEHFFDYCHVSEESNAAIAARMASILRQTAVAGLLLPAAAGL